MNKKSTLLFVSLTWNGCHEMIRKKWSCLHSPEDSEGNLCSPSLPLPPVELLAAKQARSLCFPRKDGQTQGALCTFFPHRWMCCILLPPSGWHYLSNCKRNPTLKSVLQNEKLDLLEVGYPGCVWQRFSRVGQIARSLVPVETLLRHNCGLLPYERAPFQKERQSVYLKT